MEDSRQPAIGIIPTVIIMAISQIVMGITWAAKQPQFAAHGPSR